eukprot:CAMPEP_0171454644 /NCGR_PEP_ID=MMETSP0945-20130129/1847_1 /TAXON_ID=109269 /ORGANISM="Vaucheria litorea, Strain CCMP2940" /LENGTH=107 /DNA_ID=CAMNT_0011979707 /DNA_START=40 /DNA_END=363 /DNA_ORIENTATION=+
MSESELAMTYASLILHDEGAEITSENLAKIAKAAGVSVEPYWPSLFAKMLGMKDIGDLIANVGAAGPAPAAAAPAAGGAAAPAAAKEEAPAAEEEEEEEAMDFDLFD